MINVQGRTRIILLVAGGLFLLFLLWYFSLIVTYIITSVVLSFIGRPLMRWMALVRYRKFHIPKSLAAFITLIVLWVGFVSFFRFLVPLFMKEFETFSTINFDMIFQTLQEPISKFLSFFSRKPVVVDNSTFVELITEQLNERFSFSSLGNIVSFVASTLGEVLIAMFSISFITFFFLKEESMFREGVLLIVPTRLEEKVAKILDSIARLLRRYFIGLMLEMLMVGTLDTLGLTLIGIEFNHAVVIGLFCGLFNVIPYLGAWMGAFLGLLIGIALNVHMDFMTHTLPLLGWMALVFALVKVIDDVLFQPWIYSSSVKAHPMEIFLVIMAAGSLAGIAGMLLAIPVYTIVRVIAKEFFDNLKLVRRITQNLDDIPPLPFEDKSR